MSSTLRKGLRHGCPVGPQLGGTAGHMLDHQQDPAGEPPTQRARVDWPPARSLMPAQEAHTHGFASPAYPVLCSLLSGKLRSDLFYSVTFPVLYPITFLQLDSALQPSDRLIFSPDAFCLFALLRGEFPQLYLPSFLLIP